MTDAGEPEGPTRTGHRSDAGQCSPGDPVRGRATVPPTMHGAVVARSDVPESQRALSSGVYEGEHRSSQSARVPRTVKTRNKRRWLPKERCRQTKEGRDRTMSKTNTRARRGLAFDAAEP